MINVLASSEVAILVWKRHQGQPDTLPSHSKKKHSQPSVSCFNQAIESLHFKGTFMKPRDQNRKSISDILHAHPILWPHSNGNPQLGHFDKENAASKRKTMLGVQKRNVKKRKGSQSSLVSVPSIERLCQHEHSVLRSYENVDAQSIRNMRC